MSVQIALLVLWNRPGASTTKVSVPAAAFGLLDSIFILILSTLDHNRSIRPSSILQIYLLLSLLFDIVRARTLWLISSSDVIARVFTASVVIKACTAFLECVEKRHLLKADYKLLTVESTSGVLNASVFWWLNRLLRSGSRNVFTLADLDDVKLEFRSHVLQTSLEKSWSNGILSLPCTKSRVLVVESI